MNAYSKYIRKLLLITGCITILQLTNNLYCQQYGYAEQPVQTRPFYFGFGLGVNEYGFGINLEAPTGRHTSLNGNIGLGGWGLKIGGSLNYYPYSNDHSEFSLGYSYASGLRNFHTELIVEPNGTQQTVDLDLYGVSTINLFYTYNIKVGKASKIALSGGYAICLKDYAYKIKNPVTLDQTSQMVMDIMQPGGLIVGMKLMIGGL